MNELLFATSNKGKVASMRNRLNPLGISVTQIKLDLIEPQADTCKEISEIKAKQAFEQINRPVLVDDSAFHIPSLNGFPGPYVKYILKTLGGRGILKISKGISNRYAYFESSLTFISARNKHHTIHGTTEEVLLSNEYVEVKNPEAWSELWNITMPYGSSKVYAELSTNERAEINKAKKQNDCYDQFADWLVTHRI